MAAKKETTKATAQVVARVEPQIKELADELFTSLGMNMSIAINVFLRQCIRDGKIPFEINSYEGNYRLIKRNKV